MDRIRLATQCSPISGLRALSVVTCVSLPGAPRFRRRPAWPPNLLTARPDSSSVAGEPVDELQTAWSTRSARSLAGAMAEIEAMISIMHGV